jgi:GT2 family glycosyltransferase
MYSAIDEASLFSPVHMVDVELTEPLFPPDVEGPVQLLVRRDGAPYGVVRAGSARRRMNMLEFRQALTDGVKDRLPADLLAGDGLVPVDGIAAMPPLARHGHGQLPISVVVTTCEASPTLLRTLASLQTQTHPPLEVIVVNNRPATSGVAAFLLSNGIDWVQLIDEPVPGLSRARNAGLAAASAEFVAFTDDDVDVDSRWLEAIARTFDDTAVACVTGLVLPLELQTAAQFWFEQFGGFSKGFEKRRFDLAEHRDASRLYPYAAGVFGTGANAAFRVAALRSVGGYDERLGAGTSARGGEDLDIYLTVVRSGWTLVYEPAALVRHTHHREFAALRAQVHNYGVGLAAMITKRWVTHRDERWDIIRRLLLGALHLLHPRSSKNRAKGRGYPRDLTLAELRGVLVGPFAYWKSRRTA